jgi:hypothetical protein
VILSGYWPPVSLNDGSWELTFTPTQASSNVTYDDWHALLAANDDGGLYIVGGTRTLSLFNTAGVALFNHAFTWNALQAITARINIPAGLITISGALTGNGTFAWVPAGNVFFTASTDLGVGQWAGNSFFFSGTISAVTDGETPGDGSKTISSLDILRGSTSPEGSLIAPLGTLYIREFTTTTSSVYQKATQAIAGVPDNVGWVILNIGSGFPATWDPIVRSTPQDVTDNSTPQADTQLTFPVLANGLYAVELGVYFSSNEDAIGDYAFRLGVNAGTMSGRGQALSITQANAVQTSALIANAAATTNTVNVGTGAAIIIPGSLRIFWAFKQNTSDANFQFQFANVSAAINRTSRTNAGSWLKWVRLT